MMQSSQLPSFCQSNLNSGTAFLKISPFDNSNTYYSQNKERELPINFLVITIFSLHQNLRNTLKSSY